CVAHKASSQVAAVAINGQMSGSCGTPSGVRRQRRNALLMRSCRALNLRSSAAFSARRRRPMTQTFRTRSLPRVIPRQKSTYLVQRETEPLCVSDKGKAAKIGLAEVDVAV